MASGAAGPGAVASCIAGATGDAVPAAGSKKRRRPEEDARNVPNAAASGGGSSSGGGGKRGTAALAPTVDALLPDLLLFPPGTDLHDHPLVQQGSLILQSKASCMPAHALAPQPGWHVIDACAAPGNKTTHVAALMRNSGKVFAFDKDPRRLERLKRNAAAAGASCIEAALFDFLEVDPSDPKYAAVRGLLLDPSCSGSGTVVSRMDHLLPSHNNDDVDDAAGASGDGRGATAAGRAGGGAAAGRGGGARSAAAQTPPGKVTGTGGPAAGGGVAGAAGASLQYTAAVRYVDERVEALAAFQEAALRHALRFPALQRLVYSTCSVHARENEEVVAAVLSDAQAAGFELADPFPSWHRRCAQLHAFLPLCCRPTLLALMLRTRLYCSFLQPRLLLGESMLFADHTVQMRDQRLLP